MKHDKATSTLTRRAFTLVELMIGMIITAMILGAVSALSLAMSTSWKSADGSQALCLSSHQATMRVQSRVRSCRYLGFLRAGSIDGNITPGAGVLYWKSDVNGDGLIQMGEAAWIEHDPPSKKLLLYEVIPTSSMNPTQKSYAGLPVSYATLCSSSFPDQFKLLSLLNMLKVTTLTQDLIGAKFAARIPLTSEAPSLEMTLSFQRSGRRETTYATTALRAPSNRPQ